jgi:hypothetical protein
MRPVTRTTPRASRIEARGRLDRARSIRVARCLDRLGNKNCAAAVSTAITAIATMGPVSTARL